MSEATHAYHAGEREVQRRAGVGELALKTAKVIHTTVPLAAREFLAQQLMAVVASVDKEGGAWASLLTGEPGFLEAVDEETLSVEANPSPEDPFARNLSAGNPGAPVGLLAIDLATRRRMKVKGTAYPREGGFDLKTERVYALCPKYIQARNWEFADPSGDLSEPGNERCIERGETLTEEQGHWISAADTFFVASHHPETGADASHRGGFPGFVEVLDERTLAWPDYPGNRMFNTLGNLAEDPNAGLLFVDFERGHTLQLSGEARVDWKEGRAARYAGAERVVEFSVRETLQMSEATLLRWRFGQYSPFNPS